MPDSKISAMTAATAAALTNEIPISEAGVSKKLTIEKIRDLLNGAATGALKYVSTTQVATANNTTEQTLWSQALDAGVLAENGDLIRFRASLYVSGAGDKTVRIKFGATSWTYALGANEGDQTIEGVIVRTGPTTQYGSVTFSQHNDGVQRVFSSSPAETLANSITLSLTGQEPTSATGGRVTLHSVVVEVLKIRGFMGGGGGDVESLYSSTATFSSTATNVREQITSYTVPAGKLANDGDYIQFTIIGRATNTTWDGNIMVDFDGTDLGGLYVNSGGGQRRWVFEGKIIRRNATTVWTSLVSTQSQEDGSNTLGGRVHVYELTKTLSNALIIGFDSNSSLGNNTIKLESFIVEYVSVGGSGSGDSSGRKLSSGYYYNPSGGGGAQASAFGGVNDPIYYMPFEIGQGRAFDRIALEVTTAGSAGALVRLGIYLDSNGRPGARVADLGTVASSSTGLKIVTINQTLSGLVWLAARAEVAISTVQGFGYAINHHVGQLLDGTTIQYNSCWAEYGAASGSMPANANVTGGIGGVGLWILLRAQ